MHKTTALIFGYNKYGLEIVQNIREKYERTRLYSQDESNLSDEINEVEYFDLSDDWSSIENTVKISDSIAFCVLEDDAQNIFLTISLRAYFKDLSIVAIASNLENANKLTMAGANKVIPVVETAADIIANILELPISSKVLESILFEENDLKIAQIKIDEDTILKDRELLSIDWNEYRGIIVLSLMDKDMKNEFIYSSKVKHHVLKCGDILVVVGYEKDIEDFKELIGSERI
ncbi:NAD-binding protein [Sulfurimonas sp. SAG-AH-194-C21]|nr:NAD-binding protein [Sulfurimonas sp. SAG-AH-194-C21]MDF1884251.1 NAD-binding protein [Sulfurimonas sp. SAG-AH-194-C21]